MSENIEKSCIHNWAPEDKENILNIVAHFLDSYWVYSWEQVWQSDTILCAAPELISELASYWNQPNFDE